MRGVLGAASFLAIACTPSAAPQDVEVAFRNTAPPTCGGLAIEALEPWRVDHPLLPSLDNGWSPRPEDGRPVAMRDAVAPFQIPGHRFVQVQVEGAARDVQSCWVATADAERRECAQLWEMLMHTPAHARPRNANDWAWLVATDDGASAVFLDPDDLARCDGSPAWPHDRTPGMSGPAKAPTLTFVERIDGDRFSTWLRVDISHERDSLDVVRSEIATSPLAEPRQRSVSVSAWTDPWPLSDVPSLARIEVHSPRIHPLWHTPVDAGCAQVSFSSAAPPVEGGDMFSRVRQRLETDSFTLSQLMLLHDHVGLPGVRLVLASDTESGCIMGWSHRHCFVADDAVWCPDGTAHGLQAIVDRFALTPESLTDEGWFELAVVMTGVVDVVLEPTLLHECILGARVRPKAPKVTREPNGVTIELSGVDDEVALHDHRIALTDGRVRMTSRRKWKSPRSDW